MASKAKKAKPPGPVAESYPRKAVPVQGGGNTDDERGRRFAELVTDPALAAYRALNATEAKSGLGEHIDVPMLLEHLRGQGAAVNRGDLSQAEAMLMNQATALQSLFSRLAERAMGCDTIPPFEANMRMALRAQAQCARTIEVLSALKNPPVVIAKQANVTTGPQQNNFGTASSRGEIETPPTQLSGAMNELRQDTGTPRIASEANPPLEAVAEIDRAEVRRG